MDEIQASGRQARPDDADQLHEILRHHAETHRTWYPESGPEAYAVDFRRLAHACEVFLASEVREPPGEPLGFEVSFGFNDTSGLNHPDVLDLDLGEGLTIPLRGLIDRVDRLADHYAIWDYKTGSAYKYDESNLLEGLHLQWALYGFVLEEILRLRQNTKKPIVSGYFFTSDREHGRRIRSVLPTRKEVGDLLRPLARLAERGAFPHIQRQDACRFCDYASICEGEQLLPKHLEDLNDSNPDLPVEIETWLNV
jgi:ATP-dependent helicase/DNAse subunit B